MNTLEERYQLHFRKTLLKTIKLKRDDLRGEFTDYDEADELIEMRNELDLQDRRLIDLIVML